MISNYHVYFCFELVIFLKSLKGDGSTGKGNAATEFNECQIKHNMYELVLKNNRNFCT